MTKRILLTTTSFQDTLGEHHQLLANEGFEIVRERGPLPESRMLELAGDFDGFLCGDDAITRAVIKKSLPRLKVISKYGIGLDKVDVKSATVVQGRVETQNRPRTARQNHRYHRPGAHRQGSRNPRACVRHEGRRVRQILGRGLCQTTRSERC